MCLEFFLYMRKCSSELLTKVNKCVNKMDSSDSRNYSASLYFNITFSYDVTSATSTLDFYLF